MEFVSTWNSVRLVPESVEYLGHPLPRHFIRNITMCRAMINGEEGIVVEIMFGRPILAKFLTVILDEMPCNILHVFLCQVNLPTAMLISLCGIVNRFKEKYLDMVIQVKLTVMLVLATL